MRRADGMVGVRRRGDAGLDLAISRQTTQQPGGEVLLLESSERGCTFAVRRPAAVAAVA